MNIDQLLEQAKRYVTRTELKGGDWQEAVNDILNDPQYAELFEGLDEDETFELCKEISLGSDEEEYKAYFEDKEY
jgi:hypothetical protein